MTSRTSRLSLVVLVVLALSACSAADGVDETSSVTGGTIEVAVSETCAERSGPQCVSVNGENIVPPSAFVRAGVEDATVAEGEGENAVNVTLNKDGAEVFHTLTEKATRAGDAARLVIKIGGKLQATALVMQAMEGDHIQIILEPDDSAQEVVDRIHRG